MATTWKLNNLSVDKKGIVTLSVQEIIDNVPGEIYSVRKHKSHGKAALRIALKAMIKKDRLKRAEENTIKAGIDLTNFETFLGK